jgi:hypothetical protein
MHASRHVVAAFVIITIIVIIISFLFFIVYVRHVSLAALVAQQAHERGILTRRRRRRRRAARAAAAAGMVLLCCGALHAPHALRAAPRVRMRRQRRQRGGKVRGSVWQAALQRAQGAQSALQRRDVRHVSIIIARCADRICSAGQQRRCVLEAALRGVQRRQRKQRRRCCC